jgi:hypothetical protein
VPGPAAAGVAGLVHALQGPRIVTRSRSAVSGIHVGALRSCGIVRYREAERQRQTRRHCESSEFTSFYNQAVPGMGCSCDPYVSHGLVIATRPEMASMPRPSDRAPKGNRPCRDLDQVPVCVQQTGSVSSA